MEESSAFCCDYAHGPFLPPLLPRASDSMHAYALMEDSLLSSAHLGPRWESLSSEGKPASASLPGAIAADSMASSSYDAEMQLRLRGRGMMRGLDAEMQLRLREA